MKTRVIDLRNSLPVYWAEYILLIALGAFIAKHSITELQSGLAHLDALAGISGLVWEEPRLLVTVVYGLAAALAVLALLTAFSLLDSPRAPARNPDDVDVTRLPRITYRKRLSFYWIGILVFALLTSLLLDFSTAELQQALVRHGFPGAAEASPTDWSIIALYALIVALTVPLLGTGLLFAWREPPARNSLELDDKTLTIARWGRRRSWAWQELGPFDVEVKNSKLHLLASVWSLGSPRVTVRTADGKLFPHPWKWRHKIAFHGSPLVIEDIFDTPIEEIAATLNAYRERALGGGDATGGPAPEPNQRRI